MRPTWTVLGAACVSYARFTPMRTASRGKRTRSPGRQPEGEAPGGQEGTVWRRHSRRDREGRESARRFLGKKSAGRRAGAESGTLLDVLLGNGWSFSLEIHQAQKRAC